MSNTQIRDENKNLSKIISFINRDTWTIRPTYLSNYEWNDNILTCDFSINWSFPRNFALLIIQFDNNNRFNLTNTTGQPDTSSRFWKLQINLPDGGNFNSFGCTCLSSSVTIIDDNNDNTIISVGESCGASIKIGSKPAYVSVSFCNLVQDVLFSDSCIIAGCATMLIYNNPS